MRNEAMRTAVPRYKALVRDAVESHSGFVCKDGGDALLAEFADARDAVAAALEAQRELGTQTWEDVDGLMVRMAVHTGPVEQKEGEYSGATVRCIARMLGSAHGGQIVLSSLTAQLADISPTMLRDRFPLLQAIEAQPTNLPTEDAAFV